MAKYTLNVFTGELDAYENHFGTEGIYLTDSNGVEYEITVDTSGTLVATPVVVSTANVGANAALTLLGP